MAGGVPVRLRKKKSSRKYGNFSRRPPSPVPSPVPSPGHLSPVPSPVPSRATYPCPCPVPYPDQYPVPYPCLPCSVAALHRFCRSTVPVSQHCTVPVLLLGTFRCSFPIMLGCSTVTVPPRHFGPFFTPFPPLFRPFRPFSPFRFFAPHAPCNTRYQVLGRSGADGAVTMTVP